MPGTSGGIRAGLDFRTGEAEVWEEIGRLAQTGVDVTQRYYAQQAGVQLADSINQAEGEMLKLADRLRQNPDEDTYQKELDKSIKTMAQFQPKNGMARRGYGSWIKGQTPKWRGDVEKSRQIRLDNKWYAELDILQDQAIESGGLAKLMPYIKSGIALGRIDEDTAGDVLRETNKKAQVRQAEKEAWNNPEDTLKDIDNGKLVKRYPILEDPGLMQDVRAQAEGWINYNKRRLGEILTEERSRIMELASDKTVNPMMIKEKIRQSDALTPKQKEDLYKLYTESLEVWSDTGVNTFKTTQNTQIFGEIRDKILAGQSSEKEIRDNVGPDGYSTTDEAYLLRLFKGDESKAKAFEDSAANKTLMGLIEGMSAIEAEISEPLRDYMQEYGSRLLQDAIENNPDWTDREKKEEAFRIYNNVKRKFEAGEFEIKPEKLPGAKIPLPEGAKIGQDATFPDGIKYGVFVENPNDKLNPNIELNETGVRWILGRAGGDIAKARKIAKEEGYIIPK